MRQVHLRLVFDLKFNHWLDQKLAHVVVARRVNVLAIAGAAVLAALAVAFLWARRKPAAAKCARFRRVGRSQRVPPTGF